MTRRVVELPPAPVNDAEDTAWLLPPRVVAERIGLSVRKVYELIEDGELDAVLVGSGEGRIRVRITALQAWMDSRPRHFPRPNRRRRLAAL